MGLTDEERKRLGASRHTCFCFRLRRASRALTVLYDEYLSASGIRATQMPVLVALSQEPTIVMSRLAYLLAVDRTSLTRLMSPLVRRGLVEVRSGTDQRTRLASLTAEGEAVLELALPLWEKAQRHMAELLGQGDMDNLVSDLRRTEKAMRQSRA